MTEPSHTATRIIALSKHTVLRAQQDILGCESCTLKTAEIPFTWLLDSVSGQDPMTTDYVLSEPALCPRCRGPVYEETLVER